MATVRQDCADQINSSVHKVVLAGVADVGKTTLFNRVRTGVFVENSTYVEGVESHMITENVNGEAFEVELYDTAGLERYGTLTSGYFNKVEAVILMYSVEDRYSIDNLMEYVEESRKTNGVVEGCFYALVGNKIDLDCEISKDDIEEAKRKLKCHKVYYVSAKTGENVDHFVGDLCLEMQRMRRESADVRLETATKNTIVVGTAVDHSHKKKCC